ncbi:hypothetical protein C7M84_016079 [Penaeus vannamei]|uniref:FYVE-type zinc finger domain-containing protein n=1 Tax=Penaeus vannamei TaxID=6689 RepID=A0A423SP15_PENVA|nr:hypothetical protein C7M84_016079 [Penaeus vannamei]
MGTRYPRYGLVVVSIFPLSVSCRLKTELSWLRRRGAVRADEDEGAASRTCGRCRAELGLIINRGAPCRACRQRVCKQCREYSVNGRDWVCTVCQKQIDIQLATGEWMNEFVRRPSRRRESKVYVPPADVVKRSLIKRSWTISSPPTGDRTSPELRAHSGRPVPTPRKAPRGHYAPADENEPPWDAPQYPPRAAPPRRYSMSSFDGVPPSSRHLKGPAPAPPRAHYHDTRERSPQSPFGHHSPLGHHSPQRYSSPESPPVPQRRRVLPDLPPHPGPGPLGTPERPSTLPRKLREPRHSSRQSPPAQLDPNRFHSMPRTRTRSPSGQGRGRSEPAHRPQSPHAIMHDPGARAAQTRHPERPPRPPREISHALRPGRPPEQGTPNSSLRRHPHVTSGGPRLARSDADLGSLGRLNRSDVEGVSLSRSRTEVDATPVINNRIPASRADSGVSGSSRGGTSDNSDYDMDPSNPFKKMPGPRGRPGGNPTTVNSGFATTGRPRKPSHNPAGVRRSRSFQVGSTRLEDEFPHLKESLSGQVARYVKELEKGIQMTVENMMPKKPPLPPGETPRAPASPSKDSSVSGRSRSLGRRPKDRSAGSPSDASDGSRQELEERSSSSCPHSEPSSGPRNSDTASDIVLDAQRMVPEGDDYKLVFISSDSSKDSELNSSIDSDTSASPSRRVSSASAVNDSDTAGFIDESDWDYFDSLDTAELHAMLRQTEAVQAEAQALQAALMGAFTPPDNVLSAVQGGRWFRRGDSTRSSAERSVDELSCHDQVRALGSPHDSPALREYRKRVLTEIQNYYGVNQGTGMASRPEWYSYLTRHHQGPPSPAPPRLSPLSQQGKDKPSKQSAARHRGSSGKAGPGVAAAVAGGARKSSRDICIQTDPALNTSWEEDDLTPEPLGHAPSSFIKAQAAHETRTHAHTTSSRAVSAGMSLPREAGVESTRAGRREGEGGGSGGRGRERGETSVAQPSDSEADERLLDNSSCVSSDLGGDSASDFEYRDDRGASVKCVKSDLKEGRKSEDGEASVLGAECKRDHGGPGGGEEAPRSPRIAAATTAHAHPSHNTRPSPPQPAPRRTMSALRSQHKLPAEASQPQENGGDLDASERVIPSEGASQTDSPAAPISLVPEDDSPPSSNTSEAEDTDEEMHVSRSYNISLVGEVDGGSETENLPEGEVGKHLEAEEHDSSTSSSSGSDTDEEKHVSREYTLTRSSSTDSGLEKAHSEALDDEEDEESPPVVSLKQEVNVIEAVNEAVSADIVDTTFDDVTAGGGEGEEKEEEATAVAVNKVLCDLSEGDGVDGNAEVETTDNSVEETVEKEENSSQHVETRDVQQSEAVASVRETEECNEESVSVLAEAEGEGVVVEGDGVVNEGENVLKKTEVASTSESGDVSVEKCEVTSGDNMVEDEKMVQSVEGNDGAVVSVSDGARVEGDVSVDNADTSTETSAVSEAEAALAQDEKTSPVEENAISSVSADPSEEDKTVASGGALDDSANNEGADEPCREEVTQAEVTESSSQAEAVPEGSAPPVDSREEATPEEEPVNEEAAVAPGGDTSPEEVPSGSHDDGAAGGGGSAALGDEAAVCEEGEAEAGPAATPSGDALTVSARESEPTRESEGSGTDAESNSGVATLSGGGGGESPEPAGTSAVDAGSVQVEHSAAASANHTSVPHDAPAGPHTSPLAPSADTANPQSQPEDTEALPCVAKDSTQEDGVKCESEVNSAGRESSESGHSSAGESEVEPDDQGNVVKISVTEQDHDPPDDGVSIPVGVVGGEGVKQEVRRFAVRRVRSPEVVSRHTPPVPSRRTKRSSSSDGVSSSSDIERSDADASDSADTVVEGGKLHAELRRFALQQRPNLHDHDDKSRDSDGPSSADSVLHGADSESQCSDNSEEGNLVSIVSVGDEDDSNTRLSSHGRIYIRSDSTDSDVQIKPTCIVVTGSSGAESGEDGDADGDGINVNAERNIKNEGNDVTILEVTSDGRRGHVMSVHVTSPDSSRSASPARRSQVSELQSMILTTRERQQQFRRSPTEMKESSSGLANYFTLTLGTDSPHAPRRFNKTPEIRRRKVDRPEIVESPATTSPTSPNPTPDHSEGDLLAYEEHHGIDIEEDYSIPHDYDSGEDAERIVPFPDEAMFEEDISFDEAHHFNEADEFSGGDSFIENEVDGKFDSMEDGESIHSESYYSESSGDEIMEREDELRGYCNRAIDFTLHTIIEESCEESDYERKPKDEDGAKAAPSELEKYFYYGLGNGPVDPMRYANEESEYSDTFSETSSSIFSEGLDVDSKFDEDIDPAELASSRLEKYFLLRFERQPSIRSVGEDSELHTDESGSVGSDSEGSPSPEQPRKKLVRRPRGFRPGVANRCLATSERADGAPSDGSHHSEGDEVDRTLVSGEDEGSTESEETAFDKADGQFDTIKRRKKKKSSSDYSDKRSDSDKSELRGLEHIDIEHREEICDLKNAEALKSLVQEAEKVTKRVTIECDKDGREKHDEKEEKEGDLADRKYQSRDSGFIGSSDDLLKDKPEDTSKEQKAGMSSESSLEDGEGSRSKDKDQDPLSKGEENKSDSFDNDSNNNKSENEERSGGEGKVSRSSTGSSVDLPPFCPNKARNKICRKDSFNNWSSDEETNMMMSKMRAFFKTMISNTREAPKGQRVKPPQLLAFEAKLTNLMKTVPGINDEQVKEIVEYLSSEDTWSDSYDSSDYTSSDLEGAYALLDQADPEMKSDLQEQISASCQQIIQKFDQSREPSDTDSAHSLFGGRACSESSEDASPSSRDTVFVYQRLMSSISRMKPDSDRGSIGSGSQGASPPLLAKVMHHIGNRLVALMHEVSGGSENGDDDSLSGGHPVTSSPKVPLFIPRKHKSVDSISIDSSVEKSSLTSTSFESEDSPTDTEQSPESDPGTPKARRRQGPLSIISERSSAEDFTSLESERTVFASHDSPRHHARLDAGRPQQATASQRSLEERGVTNIQYFVTEGSNNEVEEARKAKSHMSLEKIHQEEVKTTGERSESLGDLLDRVRSSEFSSSYEQLDSDSTLKASDSLDCHIGSSSSNFRLNASSRGSLTTSSRGSLAASSRGSLNAGSRGSLQGSSGPEEEDEKKPKKLSFFRYARRSSMPDTSKDRMSPEVRSTTLPRSNPTQVASTASLPRSQSALLNKVPAAVTSSAHTHFSSPPSTLDRLTGGTTGPRSARYHAPGYRPPPATTTPKRTVSTPGLPSSLRKDVVSSWAPQGKARPAPRGRRGRGGERPWLLVFLLGNPLPRDTLSFGAVMVLVWWCLRSVVALSGRYFPEAPPPLPPSPKLFLPPSSPFSLPSFPPPDFLSLFSPPDFLSHSSPSVLPPLPSLPSLLPCPLLPPSSPAPPSWPMDRCVSPSGSGGVQVRSGGRSRSPAVELDT